MKGAGKYADELKAMAKKFAKEGKSSAMQKQDPLRAIARAIFSFDTTEARADEALKIVDREFCDINELRVATELEVRALIGEKYPQIDKRAAMISSIFNGVFDKEGVLAFDRVGTLKKAEIRQFIRDLPGMTPYVEGCACLLSFDITAMPLDEMGMTYLKNAGAIDPEASPADAQKFVEGHMKPEEIWELFQGLRRSARDGFIPTTKAEEKPAKKKK